MDNEELIIKAAAKGNEQAFRIIVEKYQRFVYNICFNVIRDSQHAENIAQETFLQLYKSLSLYEYKGFKTWLGRIALNKAIDYQRKLSNIKKRETSLIGEEEVAAIIHQDSMEEELFRKEDNKKIITMCNELPEVYRDTVKKYYIQEKGYAEIALEEGVSIKTIESRLYRAKKILKERWEEDA